MKMLSTPLRRIFPCMSIEDCEIPLPTDASEIHNEGVCVLHRPSLTLVVMHAKLESHVAL